MRGWLLIFPGTSHFSPLTFQDTSSDTSLWHLSPFPVLTLVSLMARLRFSGQFYHTAECPCSTKAGSGTLRGVADCWHLWRFLVLADKQKVPLEGDRVFYGRCELEVDREFIKGKSFDTSIQVFGADLRHPRRER